MPPPVIPHFLGANIYRLLGGLPLSLEMPKEGRCLLWLYVRASFFLRWWNCLRKYVQVYFALCKGACYISRENTAEDVHVKWIGSRDRTQKDKMWAGIEMWFLWRLLCKLILVLFRWWRVYEEELTTIYTRAINVSDTKLQDNIISFISENDPPPDTERTIRNLADDLFPDLWT